MKPDRDTLDAYALGILTVEETREVEAYLDAHPDVAAEVRADQEAVALLVLSLPPEPVPAGSEDRLIERLRLETPAPRPEVPAQQGLPKRPQRRFTWWPVAAVAAVTLIAVLAWPFAQDWQVRRTLNAYQDQPGAVTRALEGPRGEQLGTLVRLADGRAFVLLNDVPAEDRVYQAWAVADGRAVSLGVFDGRRILTPPLREGAAFAVSVEPPGGSPQPTTDPIVVLPL